MEILTGEQMRRVDRRTIEVFGIPSLELMEAAGRGVALALLQDFPSELVAGVVVLCGKGNNGGDGFVAARHLAQHGATPRVLVLAEEEALGPDAAIHCRALRSQGVDVRFCPDERAWLRESEVLSGERLVLDALLGTGVRGGARGLAAQAIETLNASGSTVASIDLPSGMNADSTEIEGVCVTASRTYTLGRPKLPLVLGPAASRAGTLRVVPIGIPDEAVRLEGSKLEWMDRELAGHLLPERARDSHKGHFGHLLAVAGSPGKIGAAVLLARGALRSGVGLVTVATPRGIQSQVAVQQAEAMTAPLDEGADGGLAFGSLPALRALAEERDAVALGPGLGLGDDTCRTVTAFLADDRRPTVLDADALNALARSRAGLAGARLAGLGFVLTPHPGEAARLLETTATEVQADRLGAVLRIARSSGATVVLKGQRTLIGRPDGQVAVSSTGNPGMATAGSGDVLTGMVGAFLARGLSGWDAARLAVHVHGDAGDRAARRRGEEGLIASDIVDCVPRALAALHPHGGPTW